MSWYCKIVSFKNGGTRKGMAAFSKAAEMQNNVKLNKRKACQLPGTFSQQGDVLPGSKSPQGCWKCSSSHVISHEMQKAATGGGQGDLAGLLSLISVI